MMFLSDPVRTEGPVFLQNRDEDSTMGTPQEPKQGGSVGGYPFSFTPRLIHLPRNHELFEDGDIVRHMYLQNLCTSEPDDSQTLSVSEFTCHISGCSAVLHSLEEYEHHYNSLHRHICCFCRSCLPSSRLLDIHIEESHDTLFSILAQKQDMYQCLVEGCGQKFQTSKHRKDHLITFHKYPPDFRFNKTKKDRREKKKPQQNGTAMEVVDEVCETEGVCDVVSNVVSEQMEFEESMEIHRSEEEVVCIAESASATEAHSTGNLSTEPQKPRYSYRVPKTICFGHGSIRGFKGQRGRRK